MISAYVVGYGRNQITRVLNGQGIKVSHGSISNIINAYKRKHEQPSQLQPSSLTQQQSSQPQVFQFQGPPSDASISTGIDMNNTGSPSSAAPRDGGPLSHLLNEDPDSNSDPIVADDCQETRENIGDIDILPTKLEPFPSEDLETEMSKQAINQDDVDSQNAAPEEEERGLEQPRPRSSLSDPENPPVDQDWDPDESYQTRF